jgi:hypothetical protein
MALTPKTPDQADVFLREVDEDFRREQMQSLWQRYGRLAITAISLLLIATAGYLFWQGHKRKLIIAQADRYVEAVNGLDAGADPKSVDALKSLVKDGSPGYRALAQLDLASLALRDRKSADAKAIYDRMAKDAAIPLAFRDYASLRSIMIDFDSLKPADAIARLKPLAQETNPWFATAGELQAVAHLKAGEKTLARSIFEALQRSEKVPPSVRGRAQEMARVLGTPEAALKKLDGPQ